MRYINFYTDGSAARQPEPKSQPRQTEATRKVHRPKRYTVAVQPFALLGLVLSAVMLVMMISGFVELRNAQLERNRMEEYVGQLTRQNRELTEVYEAGYDLEEIERIALALGMIPEEQAQQFHITVTPEQPQEQATFWEKLAAFFG